MPTLLIAAGRTRSPPWTRSSELADQLPDAELHVIDGVGHLIHYEKPDEAADLIMAFIAKRVVAR